MISRKFWEDVKNAWIVALPTKTPAEKVVFQGDDLDEEISFDEIDFDDALMAVLNGEDIIRKKEETIVSKEPSRPKLDVEAFEGFMESKILSDYVKAAELLVACRLPERMEELYKELIGRLPVLNDAVKKSEGVYHAKIDQFCDYYIPEALQLTATYLDYLDIGIDEDIVKETEEEVMDAVRTLLLAVNEKIDEIYQFATIEIKAKAKALEALMGQDGYVDSEYKI